MTTETPGPSLDSLGTGAGQVELLAQQVLLIADVDTALIEAALSGVQLPMPKRKRRPKPTPYVPRHAYVYTSAS